MSTTANSTFVACNSFNRKTYLFCFGLIMLASTVSALVIFLYVHFHVAIGHKGHDHSSLVAPTFGQHQVTPDVIDVAPTKELIVRMHLIFFFFFQNNSIYSFNRQIEYGDDVDVHYGDTLTPTQVKNVPTTVKWTAEPDSFYTLIMTG